MAGGLGGLLWGNKSTPREANPLSDATPMTGASTSGRSEASPSSDLKPVNNFIWELYSPRDKGNPDSEIDAEIIFFHGLQVDDFEDAYWKTWLSKDDSVIWPREWLKIKCERARMLSVSYNSSAKEREDYLEMHSLGENLVADIIHDVKCGQEAGRPVILVGHCLGGIVIKQFILSAINLRSRKSDPKVIERIDNFLKNFQGAFFYATPNGGSPEIERFARGLRNPSPVLKLLQTLDTETGRINREFGAHRQKLNIRSFAICEKRSTKTLVFNGVIVPEASARDDVDWFYSSPSADHFTVCKATDSSDSSVIGKLADFVNEIVEDEKERLFEELKTFGRSLEPGALDARGLRN